MTIETYIFKLGVHEIGTDYIRVYNRTIDQSTGKRYDKTLSNLTPEQVERWRAYCRRNVRLPRTGRSGRI